MHASVARHVLNAAVTVEFTASPGPKVRRASLTAKCKALSQKVGKLVLLSAARASIWAIRPRGLLPKG